jgi:hypothetical protein
MSPQAVAFLSCVFGGERFGNPTVMPVM